MDESSQKTALETGARLRKEGLAVENYFEKKKIQKQFAYADKLGIPYCLVLGENEVNEGTITVKNMRDGTQKTVKNDETLTEQSFFIKHLHFLNICYYHHNEKDFDRFRARIALRFSRMGTPFCALFRAKG
ncbi:hypothetical protein HC823_00300 [Candidatus Gracilibacteria bacterium]|nr:hypothetical protein [Candidatus Gracilibacteria bacterium]